MLSAEIRDGMSAFSRIVAKIRSTKLDQTQMNAVTAFVLRASSAGILFVMQIILARWLGDSEYGLFVTAWSFVLIVGGMTTLGLGLGTMRLVPEYIAQGKFDLVRGLMRSARVISVGVGALIALIGGVVIALFNETNSPLLLAPMMLALFCIPIYAFADVQDGIGRGQGWITETLAPIYVARPILLLGILVIMYHAGLAMSGSTAMLAALGSIVISAGIQTALIGHRLTQVVPHGPATYRLPQWLRISMPLLIVTVSELVMQNADILLLAIFSDPARIGSYFAAAKTVSLALFIQFAVGSAYGGRIAAASGAGDQDKVRDLTRQSVQATFYPTLIVTLGILVLGYPILMIFGPSFTSAYPLMFIMAVGVLARSAVGPSDIILNMLGQQRACAIAYCVAAVVCIGLNVLLIPFFDVYGAAMATATAIVTAASLNWWSAKKHMGLDLFILNQGSPIAFLRQLLSKDGGTPRETA